MLYYDMCLYNNKIFVPIVDSYNSYLVAYIYKKIKKNRTRKFEECFKINIPLKPTMHVKEVALRVIENYNIGLKCIVILIFDLKGLCNAFIYSDTFKRKLLKLALPEWAEISQPQNLFIANGPSILHVSDVFHLYLVPNVSNHFNDEINSKCEKYKVLQFSCFGLDKHHDPHNLFLLLVLYSFTEQSIYILQLNPDPNNAEINFKQLPLSMFFPKYYENALKAIEINENVGSNSTNLRTSECKENMCVLITTDDCLIFVKGILNYCCKLMLSFPETISIKCNFSNIAYNIMNIIVTSEDKNVIFISTKEKYSCEVIKHWTDVKSALIGDILIKGTQQILLLKNTDPGSWQDNCVLIDSQTSMPVDLLSQNSIPDECLKTTIAGLERKVQIGKSTVEEIEYEVSQKSSATVDALLRLNEAAKINKESVKVSESFRESLLDLILSKDENKKSESISSEYDLQVKLLSESQRLTKNHWMLILRFCNDGVREMCNVSAKVLIKDNQVQCMQKLFIHKSSDFSLNDKCSRQINSKTEFSVLLSCKLPVVHEDGVIIILSWYDGSTDEFDNEIFLNEEKKVLVQHQMILHRKLMVTVDYKNDEGVNLQEDLWFSRTSQQRIILSLSSAYSDISKLENILVKKDFVNLESHENSNCLTFINQGSLLMGVHIILHRLKDSLAEIEAFTKDEKEILLLVSYLYENIPEDVIISPFIRTREEYSQMKRTAVCAMKNEVDLVFSSLNTYNASDELGTNHAKLSRSFGTVIIPKKTYQRIRRVLIKKECITDSIFRSFGYDILSVQRTKFI